MKQNPNITFLAPFGATFSHDAHSALARIHNTPQVDLKNYMPADSNIKVLELMLTEEGVGYGTIATDTFATGRVDETINSFIGLLDVFKNSDQVPFHIVGAISMKIRFCLMARKGVTKSTITKIIAHEKAIGACKKGIGEMNVPVLTVPSNGIAAKFVSENDSYRNCAAIGPKSAASKYGLKVIDDSFEDTEAITTFFHLAPKGHPVLVGEKNRVLIVFKLRHKPGALVDALVPFSFQPINLTQIHSFPIGGGEYRFAMELEIDRIQLTSFQTAMRYFSHNVKTHICFGPFQVLSG